MDPFIYAFILSLQKIDALCVLCGVCVGEHQSPVVEGGMRLMSQQRGTERERGIHRGRDRDSEGQGSKGQRERGTEGERDKEKKWIDRGRDRERRIDRVRDRERKRDR